MVYILIGKKGKYKNREIMPEIFSYLKN